MRALIGRQSHHYDMQQDSLLHDFISADPKQSTAISVRHEDKAAGERTDHVRRGLGLLVAVRPPRAVVTWYEEPLAVDVKTPKGTSARHLPVKTRCCNPDPCLRCVGLRLAL